jgi:hypothetical protein
MGGGGWYMATGIDTLEKILTKLGEMEQAQVNL